MAPFAACRRSLGLSSGQETKHTVSLGIHRRRREKICTAPSTKWTSCYFTRLFLLDADSIPGT